MGSGLLGRLGTAQPLALYTTAAFPVLRAKGQIANHVIYCCCYFSTEKVPTGKEVGAAVDHWGPRAPEDQSGCAGKTGLRQRERRANVLCVCVCVCAHVCVHVAVCTRVLLTRQPVCEVGRLADQ